MSAQRYDDLLERARKELTRAEQLDLSRALQEPAVADNGSTPDKSLLQALTERGVVGSITDAPADLGTNPRHMEGFGRDDR